MVRGTGEARALPDLASLRVEVTADRKSQDEAYEARADVAAKVGLSKALTKPDMFAGGGFVYDAEPEFRYGWRVSFGVTLPVFTSMIATLPPS